MPIVYGIKKRHIIIAFLLAFPVLIAILPSSEETRLKITALFGLPLTHINNFSDKMQVFISPKGIFSGIIEAKDNQIQALKLENDYLMDILFEGQRLKELLSFRQGLQFKTIASHIIARDPSNWRNSIIIDKGAAQAVGRGMFLMSQQGLAGRIIESARTMSKAVLLTDPDFNVAAVCQRSREQMIVVGNGRNLSVLKYLPQDADVRIKDIIVTSGLGGFCPKGILIGEVVSVRKAGDGLTLEAYLKPSAPLNRLEEVLVLIE